MIVNILVILLILTFIGYSFVYAFFPNKGNVFVENRDTDGPIDMPIGNYEVYIEEDTGNREWHLYLKHRESYDPDRNRIVVYEFTVNCFRDDIREVFVTSVNEGGAGASEFKIDDGEEASVSIVVFYEPLSAMMNKKFGFRGRIKFRGNKNLYSVFSD